jgi:hypothetical protein
MYTDGAVLLVDRIQFDIVLLIPAISQDEVETLRHAFVASFVTHVIGAYVERASAAQLGLLSLGG